MFMLISPALISTQAALSLLIQSISPFPIGLQILRQITYIHTYILVFWVEHIP